MRRLPALLLVLALAGCSPFADDEEEPVDRLYSDPAGWVVRHPSAWTVERSSARLRLQVWSITVASFPPARAVRRTEKGFQVRAPLDRRGEFPQDGAAFRVLRFVGGPGGPETSPEELEVDLADFRPADTPPADGVRPVEHQLSFGGSRYLLQAWVGPEASDARKDALEEVVSSLSFAQ